MKPKVLKTISLFVEGEEELLSIYVAADGNGAMIYPEDQDFSENGFPCLTMNTTATVFLDDGSY